MRAVAENAQQRVQNAQVDLLKCSVSTTEGILLCMGYVQHAEHADLRKPFGLNRRSVRRRTARNGRFQNTPQLTVALRSRKALNGNGSLRFAAFSCGAVQRRYYLENDDSRNDAMTRRRAERLGRTPRNAKDDAIPAATRVGLPNSFLVSPYGFACRDQLQKLLQVASGGGIFTTVQKFFPSEKGAKHPLLSDRRNVVVIADEAHRSQYDFIDGFARHMREALPNAAWIGFTGTPIERADANTRAVFGDYISIYDILRAVEDKATVPIYYENRLAKLELDPKERPKIDPDFEEATEGEEVEHKERLKTKWAALEAVVGVEERVALIAEDSGSVGREGRLQKIPPPLPFIAPIKCLTGMFP